MGPRTKRFVQLALLLLIAAVLAFGTSPAQALVLHNPQNVSRDEGRSVQPRTALDPDGNAHVIWREEPGIIAYAKGIWNGSGYDFGQKFVLDDTGFSFATPNLAVAPNGVLLATWSAGFESLRLRAWNARDGQPSGGTNELILGIRASVAADSNGGFHIAGDRNGAIHYCHWDGGAGCRQRETFPGDGGVRSDIVVDSGLNVHVIWDVGQQVKYRARSADGSWGGIDTFGGNFPQIAADGQGNVHLVWSRDYDILYCRRVLISGCVEQRSYSIDRDVRPSVGASQGGDVLIAWREEGSRQIAYAARENGQWTSTVAAAAGPTDPDVNAWSSTNRFAVVWSLDYDIQLIGAVFGVAPPPPPQPAPPQPAPPVAGRLFPETGQTVTGVLLDYWDRNGSLPVFGLPLSAEDERKTLDGTYRMQIFERNRLELHPENPAPYNVLLGRLGGDVLYQQGRPWETLPKEQPRPGCQFFPETGHNLCQPFLGYWRSRGLDLGDPGVSERESLALFGLPLTGVNQERNGDGWTGQTQWFERARFELHPELPAPYRILLGRLGAEAR